MESTSLRLVGLLLEYNEYINMKNHYEAVDLHSEISKLSFHFTLFPE